MPPFDTRLTFFFTNTDVKDLDLAVQLGFTGVTTGWIGSDEILPDNLPIYCAYDAAIADRRRPRYPKIREQIEDLSRFHAAAHDRGLDVVMFSYEPSVPAEVVDTCPAALHPHPAAFLALFPADADQRHICIYDERTREWVAEKVAETIRNVGPIDAWMYTTNETMLSAGLTYHVCANCYDEPRWMALCRETWLHRRQYHPDRGERRLGAQPGQPRCRASLDR